VSKRTHKQQRFVDEFPLDLNATQAALRAGYSPRTSGQIGYENLKKPEIVEAIHAAFIERQRRTEITQDWVVDTLREIVMRSMRIVPALRQNGTPVGDFTFNPTAATRALELLGRHLGMWRPIGTEEDPLTIQLRTVNASALSQLRDDELKEIVSHGKAIRERLALPDPGDSGV